MMNQRKSFRFSLDKLLQRAKNDPIKLVTII